MSRHRLRVHVNGQITLPASLRRKLGLKPGDLNHILRVATTGVTIGPGVFECLAILGKPETLRRIDMAQKLVAG